MASKSRPQREPRKIDPQGRVHLPPDIMEALKVGPGEYVSFELEGNAVCLYKVEWVVKR